jgi:ABC-type antimicrobial peptide transport system permease subunit
MVLSRVIGAVKAIVHRSTDDEELDAELRDYAGSPAFLAPAVASALIAVDPHLSFTFRTVAQDVDASIARERLLAQLSSAFAVLALLLAALGLYGMTSYAVVRRRAEIGMRMALGARRSTIIVLVIGRSLMLTMAGIALGLAASAGVTRYLGGMLYGLTPLDIPSFAGVAVVFAAVAALSSLIPAHRAARVDPLVAIRGD